MTIMTLNELKQSKIRPPFHFFWTTASPFSQFYRCSFKVDGLQFTCAEQFMMYSKAMHFKDLQTAYEIMQIPYPPGTERETPKQYKALGRKVKNFNRAEWERVSTNYVYKGNQAKFTQNPDLKKYLLQFAEASVFVEASPYDTIWGIGLKESDPRAKDPNKWCGQNKLGFVLTTLRNDILKGVS